MHNFRKPSKPVSDSLNDVGKGLREPKKSFFTQSRATLESLYNHYDTLAVMDELHTLTRNWKYTPGMSLAEKETLDNSRSLANQLYDDDRPFVNKHWEFLTQQNGGDTLYCPICGLHECEEMDHYVPRDVAQFPEYSAHISNLIPLCHSCNHKKSSKFLDASGRRIYFNAFYDILTTRDLLICFISKSPIDGLPQISTMLNAALTKDKKPDVYILSTIADLGLMDRFEAKARLCLKKEMTRLKGRVGQDWDMIKAEMESLSKPSYGDPDIVTPAVLRAISGSKLMKDWFESL